MAAVAISRLRLLVERPQQRPLCDIDEVASVDDRAHRILDLSPRMRRLGAVAIERDELADEPARRGAIVGGARLGERHMHFRDPDLSPTPTIFARGDADQPDQEYERAKTSP